MARPDYCPKCGSLKVAKILYGLADLSSPELCQALDEGQVVLGGDAIVIGKCKDWRCLGCGQEWGDQNNKISMSILEDLAREREEEELRQDKLAAQRAD
jgi:hypothetical protein